MFKMFSFTTFETSNEFKFCVFFLIKGDIRGKDRRGDGGHVFRAQMLRRVGN